MFFCATKTTVSASQITVKEIWFKNTEDVKREQYRLLKQGYNIHFTDDCGHISWDSCGICVKETVTKLD